MGVILKVENISKQYRLGLVGTGTLGHDLNRFWSRIRGKEDPYLKIGAENDRSKTSSEEYVWALRDINFEVQKGEVLGIIGKNGAGKSTLLKLLSRVTAPTTGVIKTKGRIASLLEVGTGFHPELTGLENIYLNGAILGMNKAEIKEKEEEIIAFSGCQMYIDTPVKRYSSGMRVRLAFAVAAHLEPDILVVDEVLAVGDAEFQKKAIGKMQDISRGHGRTVIFVSHNMATVKSLCTRAVVLEHGKTVFEGATDEAVKFYLTLGASEENISLKNRKIREGNGKWRIINIEYLNIDDKPVAEVISGKSMKFRITFEKYKDIDVKNLFFGLAILDNHEQKVATFLSDEMDTDMSNLINADYLIIEVPQLLLRGGNYNVTLHLGEGSTNESDFVDYVENAAKLEVLKGDFWNKGRANREGEYAIIPGSMY